MTNKYNTSDPAKRRWQGRTYDSKAEMEYAKALDLLRQAGEVIEYIEQPRCWLGVPENIYVPDFFVVEPTQCYYVDVKGMETAPFKRNKKLWKSYGRHPLRIVKRKGGRFTTTEVIEP